MVPVNKEHLVLQLGMKPLSPEILIRHTSVHPDRLKDTRSSHNFAVCCPASNSRCDQIFASFECSTLPSKWMHSVLNEGDFCDEWTALDNAFHLAAELNLSDLNHFSAASVKTLSNFARLSRDNDVRTVRFKDEVELFIGLDEDLTFERIYIPAQSLNMANKPWSLLPCLDVEPTVPNHCFSLHPKNSCEVHDFSFCVLPK